MELVYHEESPCFNFSLEPEIAEENTCDQYEAISFPKFLKCSKILNLGLAIHISIKIGMVDLSRCDYVIVVHLESSEYFSPSQKMVQHLKRWCTKMYRRTKYL